jgi:hypothetical protein
MLILCKMSGIVVSFQAAVRNWAVG